MPASKVAIATSGWGLRLWLPDGTVHLLTTGEARDLVALLNEAAEVGDL